MLDKLQNKIYHLLRKSEEYTKTDMVYLAKGGFWLTLGQFISSGAAFLLAIAFANLLPKETYGTYRYVLSLVGVLNVFTLSGINTAVIQAVARKYEAVYWPSFVAKLRWSLLASLGSLGIASYYYMGANLTLTISFVMVAVFLPLLRASGLYIAVLNGRKDFKLSATYNSLVRIVASLVMLSTLFFTDNIFFILAAFLIPDSIMQFIFTWVYIKKHPLNKDNDPKTVSYGLNLSAMELLKTIAGQVDKILIFHYLGAAQLAIYAFTTAPVSQIKSVLLNLKSLALPKLSEVDEKDIKDSFLQKVRKLEIVVILIIILYAALAPLLYKFVFPQYIESARYSQVYVLTLLFFPRTFLSTVLVAKMKQKELYSIRIISPIFRIVILFVALKFYGLWGMIIGTIISEAVLFALYRTYYKKAFS
ncbi:oligosaccharide flippase family protein [Candidatus Parcubacteria bacterium]|jgi:O-antigen/teichoic acid export membrane protein|nr:oligosaccharide flippase family protein [Candidatus Parcubacteria bacterium]